MGRPKTTPQSFWANVDKSAGPTGCWPWMGALQQKRGYGKARLNYKCFPAHRLAFFFERGYLPEDNQLVHTCRNNACCNLLHLVVKTDEERFWSFVEKNGPIPEHMPHLGQCWVWVGSKRKFGHGHFPVKGVGSSAHRYSWFLHNGPIPEGLCVLHHCDRGECQNPAHLFIGDDLANGRDAASKGRTQRGEKNKHAILTAEQVVKVRELAASGMGHRLIGEQFGIATSTVSSIHVRKSWKHVI